MVFLEVEEALVAEDNAVDDMVTARHAVAL